jgi:hypothetical protein
MNSMKPVTAAPSNTLNEIKTSFLIMSSLLHMRFLKFIEGENHLSAQKVF